MSTRGLHVDSIAELAKDGQYIFHLFEFLFDAGTERFTNAHADITFDSNLYTASSRMVSFGNVTETQRLEISSMSFVVSGVDQTSIAAALSADTVDRKIKLYQGLLDPLTYAVIADPILVYTGRIKAYSVKETPGGTSTLTWSTGSILADFDKTAGRRSNHQDQEAYMSIRALAGVDLGFEFAHQVTSNISWGRP